MGDYPPANYPPVKGFELGGSGVDGRLKALAARTRTLTGLLQGLCSTLYSKKLEHGCRIACASCPSSVGLVLEDGHVSTFWLPL